MSPVSCLEALFRRIGGLSASAVRPSGMETAAVRKGGMTCSFGLICRTSIGDWPLWASDQMVLTIDGGKVYVTKTS